MPLALKFTRNWNGKLDNTIFTTIRKADNPLKTNDVCEIWLKDVKVKDAVVLFADVVPFEELNWITLAMDTGYLKAGAEKIFENLGIKPGDKVKVLVLNTINPLQQKPAA